MDRDAIVVGASRGIGLALVQTLLGRTDGDRVFAGSRDPDASAGLAGLHREYGPRLEPFRIDVAQEASVQAAAEAIRGETQRVQLLIVTAGLLHDEGMMPEKRLEALDAAVLQRSFTVNSVGPLLVAKHFWRLLEHDGRAVFAALSARVGSIGDNRAGGWYGYRASKAAQNMLMRTLSIELRRRAPKVICASLHPGTVDTDLSAPFGRHLPPEKRFAPELAAKQLLEVIDSLRPEDSGSFFAWDGRPIPW